MAKCNLRIDFKGNATELIAKAKKAISEAGGRLEGNEVSGHFTIPVPGKDILGDYTIEGNTFVIAILEKAMLISCDRIENELIKYLNQEDVA
jgi:hypothetical protein